MFQAFFVLAASLLAVGRAAECNLAACEAGQTCYASSADVMDCLYSIPFNKEWATATVDVISQSLANYGFLALYHNSGPPYVTHLDIMQELAKTQKMVDGGDFATDMDFQDHMMDLITITHDAHTRYQKPVCYNAVFAQPFALDVRVVVSDRAADADAVEQEPRAFMTRNLYTDAYLAQFPDSPIEGLFDQEITLVNGLELTTALSDWADYHETRSNNRGVRFNTALRSFLFQSAIQYKVTGTVEAPLKVTLANGATYALPWLGVYGSGLADVDYCAAEDPAALQAGRSTRPNPNPLHHPELLTPPTPLVQKVLTTRPEQPEQSTATKGLRGQAKTQTKERTVIVPADSEYMVSCFTQQQDSAEAGVDTVLVMKVASFAPPGAEGFKGFMQSVETCLSVEYDLMVVDVMQNGGGIVCLGLRLLQLLIEDYNQDPSLVQMNYDLPHSPLMDRYIETVNSNEGYINLETGEPYADGKAYYYGRNVTMGGVEHQRSNYFALDCSDFDKLPVGFKPKKFLPPERLILLTDGTCGSTCACFTKIPQEHGKATLVGVGGLWEEAFDVSSFAGGFVSNPDVMAEIADESGIKNFPAFKTNQHWQFDWAIWYSKKFPTRPAQFVVTEPDYREAFWGFPHSSIDAAETTAMVSALYDRVIDATVVRLAAGKK